MAEILHHLGCMKPYKQWEKLPTSTGDRRISAINTLPTNQHEAIFCIPFGCLLRTSEAPWLLKFCQAAASALGRPDTWEGHRFWLRLVGWIWLNPTILSSWKVESKQTKNPGICCLTKFFGGNSKIVSSGFTVTSAGKLVTCAFPPAWSSALRRQASVSNYLIVTLRFYALARTTCRQLAETVVAVSLVPDLLLLLWWCSLRLLQGRFVMHTCR